MSRPLFQVDAFTAEPFTGNPAAVCLLEEAADPGWMQRGGGRDEPVRDGLPGSRPRAGCLWAALVHPTVEVELCGHATLASAHVLWTEGRVPAGQAIRFDTASGPLAAHPGTGGTIWLDFPAMPPSPVDPPPGLVEALGGGTPRWVGLVQVRPDGDRTRLGGQAVTVLRGELA